MAPKVLKVYQTRVGGGAPKFFKKSRRIVVFHWGRALLENKTFAQIQEIPAIFSTHGLFGKKISKRFEGPAWDPTILSESFKFCLRERWANCEPNNERTDARKHLDHHNKLWDHEYTKHFPGLMMSQKKYLTYTLNKFNSMRIKLNNVLNKSCGEPIDGLREMDPTKFLNRLKAHDLIPSIHVRYMTVEDVEIQILTEVMFYFHPDADKAISPPTYTMKVKGHLDSRKPLFVV